MADTDPPETWLKRHRSASGRPSPPAPARRRGVAGRSRWSRPRRGRRRRSGCRISSTISTRWKPAASTARPSPRSPGRRSPSILSDAKGGAAHPGFDRIFDELAKSAQALRRGDLHAEERLHLRRARLFHRPAGRRGAGLLRRHQRPGAACRLRRRPSRSTAPTRCPSQHPSPAARRWSSTSRRAPRPSSTSARRPRRDARFRPAGRSTQQANRPPIRPPR